MTYMNRPFFLILLLLLTGCNVFTFAPLIPVFKNAVFGVEDYTVTDEFIASREYSFIKVKIGRSAIALFVLLSIDEDDNYYWTNSSGEKIITNNGKVIEITGLVQGNFKYTGLNKTNFPKWQDLNNFLYLAEYYDPKAFFNIEASLIRNKENTIIESIYVKDLNWKFKNRYIYEDGLAKYSEQIVHPHLSKLTIEYYYK